MHRSPGILALIAAATLAACSKTADAPKPEADVPATPAATEAAPAVVPASQSVRTFKIGEFSALALSDGYLDMPNDNKVFGVGRTPEDVAAVLSAAGVPTDQLHLDIHPLLVRTADKVLLFDTGAAGIFGPTTGKLPATLAEAGVDPQSVTDVFISHAHGDHVGGLASAEGALNFPNATIHISKPEWESFSGMKEEWAKKMTAAIKPKVDAFAPGADLVPGVVKAVEIKGHTPGHSGYLITSGAESVLYVGDSMHHYIVSVQKPEWTIAFDGDKPTAEASRAALIAQSAASGQRIYAFHFPFPGIGKIEKQGDVSVWVAE